MSHNREVCHAEDTGWTQAEVAARLGLSSILFHDRKLDAEIIAKWADAGIPYMEVCGGWPSRSDHYNHANRPQVKEVARLTREHGVTVCSVHGPAPSDELMGDYSAEDKRERQRAIDGTLAAAEAALELEAEVLVLHLGTSSYSLECIREILQRFPHETLQFVNENGKDLREYVNMIDTVDSQQFGICIDVGHTRDQAGVNPLTQPGSAYPVIAQCGQRLRHLHLHDFCDTDHYPPFMGTIQWKEIFAALKDIRYDGIFMFEPSGNDERRGGLSRDGVLQKVADFPADFFAL